MIPNTQFLDRPRLELMDFAGSLDKGADNGKPIVGNVVTLIVLAVL